MKHTSALALSLSLGLTLSAPLAALAGGDHGSHSGHAMSKSVAGSNTPVAGEVKKVDKDAGKITIRHGELKDLGMPAMTMVFQVKDRAMLERVNPGDQVNFVADKVDGKLTVTQLESR